MIPVIPRPESVPQQSYLSRRIRQSKPCSSWIIRGYLIQEVWVVDPLISVQLLLLFLQTNLPKVLIVAQIRESAITLSTKCFISPNFPQWSHLEAVFRHNLAAMFHLMDHKCQPVELCDTPLRNLRQQMLEFLHVDDIRLGSWGAWHRCFNDNIIKLSWKENCRLSKDLS